MAKKQLEEQTVTATGQAGDAWEYTAYEEGKCLRTHAPLFISGKGQAKNPVLKGPDVKIYVQKDQPYVTVFYKGQRTNVSWANVINVDMVK